MTDQRAVNTVLDVALAVLFVGIALTLLSGLSGTATDEHDPFDADRMANVIGSSTVNVTHSIEPIVETAHSELEATPPATADDDLIRHSHGTIASQIGSAAVANFTIGVADDPLTEAGSLYENALDDRVQARLVGSKFETRLTAFWEPYEGSIINGTATVGVEPPPETAISTATLSVPSGIEPVRDDALATVADGGGYDAVAQLIAKTIIEGYLPQLDSTLALERSGTERTLMAYRYERMATILEEASSDSPMVQKSIEQSRVDPPTVHEYLARKLTSQLSSDLSRTFNSPKAAAATISTGELTVTINTWEP